MRLVNTLMAAALACGSSFACAQAVQYAGGKATFDGKCVVCHQAGGKGMDGLAPPLVEYPGKYAGSDDGRKHLGHTLLSGMFGPIKVKDKNYNFKMPAFASLSDAEIADVLNYVVFDLNAQHGNAKPFDAAEIKALRAAPVDASAVHQRREGVVKGLGL
ncbi:Methylamine dehydrogenase light chain precursor [Caballeronia glathei]|uniref:Cytochrome C n=1 Tax=Caballeronia glathei TaxID=60547 RepID=A0A069Q1Q7_9BURK|nr:MULTISPECIES: cytochrome c [Burkholderiaceae]KDR43646.1 cytochrome C [Caballeronia glathei]TCK43703.1 cytochrome c [Paraburkholderia sp. BL8N3]CDY75435.1 Methylamine dehydrogenase light chain precursor [Caballeronia glathei]